MLTRAEREKQASDETSVYENWYRLQGRFSHIFTSPNTQRMENTIDAFLCEHIAGKRVLEIGCGKGYFAQHLTELGASYVCATDISQSFIDEAKAEREIPGIREYMIVDNERPITGHYDLIVGRAVLHHLDYQETLQRLTRDNLLPDGMLLFVEPLNGNWLMRLFRLMSKHAHTPDERAFDTRDLVWMRHHYPSMHLIPFNLCTIPFGIISSLVFPSANNWLMRVVDRIDVTLARFSWLHTHFRYALLILRK